MPEQPQSEAALAPPAGNQAAEGMPLIFISHDSRDAELAEAFSKLLKSVSAGMLKSFRSSDRLGTEGIQYGDEWYKRLMERLTDASDVVCLFTKRSLHRPWILFEAGVAKGKLSTPVHGVALGVPLDQVSTGPFYQFQNCQDDEDGLTGLVMQLLNKIPNAEPDHEAIALQVKTFKANVDDILSRLEGVGSEGEGDNSEVTTTSGAKLFEEIKVMVRDLPSNVEDRLAEGVGPFRGRRSRRLHPMMIEEMHMMGMKSPPHLSVLILASFLRDEIPWLYDLALDVYRSSLENRLPKAREALRRFEEAIEFSMHHPMMEEVFMGSKEGHMMIRGLQHSLERLIDRCKEAAPSKKDVDE